MIIIRIIIITITITITTVLQVFIVSSLEGEFSVLNTHNSDSATSIIL